MKNTKAIFLIVLGSFVLATGFAFAQEAAYDQLRGGPFGSPVAADFTVSADPDPSSKAAAPAAAPAAEAKAAAAPAVPAVSPPAPAPAPAPTFGESFKKVLKSHMTYLVMGGIGAYLGMALIGGPIGMLIGGLLMFGLAFMGGL